VTNSEPARTVLSRAFAILDTFADGEPEQTHGSITRATGLSPATAHRILAELVDWGAVERTGRGRSRIGLHLWRLGALAPQGRELRDVALPYLQDLLEVTHEVVHLVALDENQALYVEKLESRPGVLVVSQVGGRLPLHATGPGKVLLAHAPRAYSTRSSGSRCAAICPITRSESISLTRGLIGTRDPTGIGAGGRSWR